jgi:tripartite ATP-independent transporter DctM subunit
MVESAIGCGVLLALLLLGVPIALAMGFVGVVGFALVAGWDPAMAMTGQIVVDNILNYNFSILPLFILMGNLISHARLSDDLYEASNAFLGHRRGGVALATIVACGGFSALCGSSMATAATMSKVALPSMRRYGYDSAFAAACVAAGGTLGILIPPSIIMIIYGFMTNSDVGQLFMAGVLPGIMGIALYAGAVVVVAAMRPKLAPKGERTDWPGRWRALGRVWGIALLLVFILGGIYLGVFTPNEAAGVGAGGALLFALLRGTLRWGNFYRVLVETVTTTATMFFVLFGALLFSNFLNISGGATWLSGFVQGLDVAPVVVILVICLIYMVLGTMLESLSMMLLTVPIFAPIVVGLNIDLIWFGIIVVVAIEISLITPPVGMNVFVLNAVVPDVPAMRIFRAITAFFFADILRLGLIIAFPAIATFLPSVMSK